MITIDLRTKQLHQALGALEAKLHNMSPLMSTLAEMLYTLTDESFEKKQSPNGKSWQPLAPATLRAKKSPHILYESGTMRDSLYASHTAHRAEVGVGATSKGFAYPLSHQFGAPSRNIPARPFLPVEEDGTMMSEPEAQVLMLLMQYLERT